MYPIKSVNNYEGTSEFIKKIIALIDKNKDGKIQNEELQASYNKPELSHIFSWMVCKHKSEWSYKWVKIKSDYEKFIKYHYPKAKQEYVNERLDEIQAKYDTLYDFWDKLEFKTDTFWYFEPFAWVEQMKRLFPLEIDLSDPDKWISQFTQPRPNVACYRTCCLILNNYGVTCGGLGKILEEKYDNGAPKYSNVIQVVIRTSNGKLENTGNGEEAINYINSELEKGHPILIGVDRESENKDYNKDLTTEHFIVITGRKNDDKGIYYRFFEVGTNEKNKELKGVNPNNKLYLQTDYNLIGNVPQSTKKYTLTQVRKNL